MHLSSVSIMSDVKVLKRVIKNAFIEGILGQKTTSVQSLIFKKSKFTRASARTWAKNHGFKNSKVDITTNSIRLRQFDPGRCKSGNFKTKPVTPGVKVVLCKKK